MLTVEPPITKGDFFNTDWRSAIDGSERKECVTYSDAFWRKAEETYQAGDMRAQAVFAVLAIVTSAAIKADSTDTFFAETFANLTDGQLDFLTEIAPEIDDPELQARVGDILWVRRRKYQMAQLAIAAYLQSAIALENSESWLDCCERLERALALASLIRHRKDDVLAHIETVLDCNQGKDRPYLLAEMMKLLLRHQHGETAKYTALTEQAARLAEANAEWQWARKFWDIKAIWHCQEKDKSQQIAAMMAAAETYVREAEAALERTPPSYMAAAHFLQNAVAAFRNVPGTKEETAVAKARAKEVQKLLLRYQAEIPNEMIPISSPSVDVADLVEMATNNVRGKSLHDALFALACFGAPIDVTRLRQQVQQYAKDFVLHRLFPTVMMNGMGRVVARQPASMLSGNPAEAEEALLFEMYQHANYHHDMHAQAIVEPARWQINLEHNVRVNDILSIIEHSPFVPPRREYLFAKGLHAGLIGDFFTSTHLLIPQIENSVRYLLSQKGEITSGLDTSGIQNEHNLNDTLYRKATIAMFGENLVFDLKCLLVERAGSNMRNQMAHGLMDDAAFVGAKASYLWWLTLRLCLFPLLRVQQEDEQTEDGLTED